MPHLNEKRYKMITLQLEIDIAEDRRLTIQLPENCQTGKHQVVVVLNPEDTSVLDFGQKIANHQKEISSKWQLL
ncbi:MAG: hypothetical protein F6J86_01765 [Symploca sp. SIO1B1]|nr:hypothetical protein [Symploca sp. SIO1C2]NER92586.1 hypothetical protein [Symploca sp. SIO1B1]